MQGEGFKMVAERGWTRNRTRDTSNILLLEMRLFLILSLLAPFGLSNVILHANVGSVSYQLEPVYIAKTKWTHGFRVEVPCILQVIKPEFVTGMIGFANDLSQAVKSYAKFCNIKDNLMESSQSYFWEILASEYTLVLQVLKSYEDTIQEFNELKRGYADITAINSCKELKLNFASLAEQLDAEYRQWKLIQRTPNDEPTPTHNRKKRLVDEFEKSESSTVLRSNSINQPQASVNPGSVRSMSDQTLPAYGTPGSRYDMTHNKTIYLHPHSVFVANVHLGDNAVFMPNLPNSTSYPNDRTYVYNPTRNSASNQNHNHHRNEINDQPAQTLQSESSSPRPIPSQSRTLGNAEPTPQVTSTRLIQDMISEARVECYSHMFDYDLSRVMSGKRYAIEELARLINVDVCSVSTIFPHCRNSSHSNQHSTRRSKRSYVSEETGVLGWNWSINKWLWGAMDRDDAKKINEMFNSSLELSKDIYNKTMTIQSQSVSVMTTMQEDLKTTREEIQRQLNAMNAHTSTWSNDMAAALRSIGANTTTTALVSTGSIVILQSGQFRKRVDIIIEAVRRLSDYCLKIWSAVSGYKVPLGIISHAQMNDALRHIKQQIPPSLQSVPTKSNQNLFNDLLPTCVLQMNGVIFYYQVPLIASPFRYTPWRMVSIPFDIGGVTMLLDNSNVVTLLHKNRLSWYHLSHSEYDVCTMNPLRVCPFTPPLYDDVKMSCNVALINSDPISTEICHASPILNPTASQTSVIALDGSRWLVSSPKSGTVSSLRCKNNSTNIAEDRVVNLSGIQEVTIPYTCTLSLGSLTLTPYDSQAYSSLSVTTGHTYVHNVRPEVFSNHTLQTLWSSDLIPKQLNLSINTMNMSLLSLKPLLAGSSLANLSDLVKDPNSTWDKLAELHSIGPYSPKVKDLQASITFGGSSIQVIGFGIPLQGLITFQFGVCTCVVIYALYHVVVLAIQSAIGIQLTPKYIAARDQFAMAMPIPGGDLYLFAGDDPSETTTTTSSPEPTKPTGSNLKVTNHTSITKSGPKQKNLIKHETAYDLMKNISDRVDKVLIRLPDLNKNKTLATVTDYVSDPIFILNTIIMTTLMVIIAFICHKFLTAHIENTMISAIQRIDGIVRNTTTIHHASETQIVIGILVAFVRTLKGGVDYPQESAQAKQIIYFQLCTVPHSRREYSVLKIGQISSFIKQTSWWRWSSALVMTLTWGPMCLKLKNNESLEICDALPKKVKLPMHEVVAQCNDLVPRGWTKISIESLIEISALDHTGKSILYKSGLENPDISSMPKSRAIYTD